MKMMPLYIWWILQMKQGFGHIRGALEDVTSRIRKSRQARWTKSGAFRRIFNSNMIAVLDNHKSHCKKSPVKIKNDSNFKNLKQ